MAKRKQSKRGQQDDGPQNSSTQNNGDVQATAKILKASHFSGPLPPADEIERYDAIHPGAAQIIFQAFQNETSHRHDMDKKYSEMDRLYLSNTLSRASLGTWPAFLVCLATLALAAYIAWLGSPVSAATLGGGTLAGLAGVFVYGTKQKSERNSEK